MSITLPTRRRFHRVGLLDVAQGPGVPRLAT
jgi:hypothetical protein